jgi:hypothetical protein
MVDREVRNNEVRTLLSHDGRVCAAIVRRADGLFCFYEDHLTYDDDTGVYYWSETALPTGGLFGTADEAEQEIPSRPGY